jgi:hypothetical protein
VIITTYRGGTESLIEGTFAFCVRDENDDDFDRIPDEIDLFAGIKEEEMKDSEESILLAFGKSGALKAKKEFVQPDGATSLRTLLIP